MNFASSSPNALARNGSGVVASQRNSFTRRGEACAMRMRRFVGSSTFSSSALSLQEWYQDAFRYATSMRYKDYTFVSSMASDRYTDWRRELSPHIQLSQSVQTVMPCIWSHMLLRKGARQRLMPPSVL